MLKTTISRAIPWLLSCAGAIHVAAAQAADAAPGAASQPNAVMREALGSTQGDPLANYYENTLVCLAAASGEDLCHMWYYRDGRFILFDAGMARTGHYVVGPVRADGKVPICHYADSPRRLAPAELAVAMPGPPPGAGGKPMTLVCKSTNFHTRCERKPSDALTDEEQKLAANDHFYNGMCYPLGLHAVGDVWFEDDDPLPGQLGMDKLMLLPGHQ